MWYYSPVTRLRENWRPAQRLKDRRILLLIPYQDERDSLAAILGFERAEVLIASSPEQAMALVNGDRQVDAIVVDVYTRPGHELRTLAHLQLIQHITETRPRRNILMVAVSAREHDKYVSLAVGFDALLLKPYASWTLVDVLVSRTGECEQEFIVERGQKLFSALSGSP